MSNCYKKRGWLRIDVERGCMPPDYYGLAYIDYQAGKSVCYPLIINWVVWLLREIYYKLKYTPVTNNLLYRKRVLVGYFTDYNKTYFEIVCVGLNEKDVVKKLIEAKNKTGRIDIPEIAIAKFIL